MELMHFSCTSRGVKRGTLRLHRAEHRDASETEGNPHLHSQGLREHTRTQTQQSSDSHVLRAFLPFDHCLCEIILLLSSLSSCLVLCSPRMTTPPLMRNWTSSCTLPAPHTWSPLPVTGQWVTWPYPLMGNTLAPLFHTVHWNKHNRHACN